MRAESIPLFHVQGLACRRNQRRVFRDISFALNAGDLLLITGENGCGKSSLLRILATLLAPVQGEMLWRGSSVSKDVTAHRERINYIGHLDALKPELTVSEIIDYWRALRGKPRIDSAECLEITGLTAKKDSLVRTLSAGQKRRLTLTRLLMDDSPLWLLDEPTTALDQQGQMFLFDLIESHRQNGGIAIIATHQAIDLPHAQNLGLSQ